ncbi:MAG: Alkyl hydroperoxide reductase subunit C-like protein, partial [uncultured Friedmanniella sp.]
ECGGAPGRGDRPRLHRPQPARRDGHPRQPPRRARGARLLSLGLLRHLHRRAVRAARRPGPVHRRLRAGAGHQLRPDVRPAGLRGRRGPDLRPAGRPLAARPDRPGLRRLRRGVGRRPARLLRAGRPGHRHLVDPHRYRRGPQHRGAPAGARRGL